MPVIAFDNVDLVYPIRENRRRTLKDFILKGLFRKPLKKREFIQALSNITFKINEGERVGIIGHNGAGKSTLLRTIGGVYPIAKGRRLVEGSICSLFDITHGFEWNASGWDNIRLRGFLQGETPRTIATKMEEIREFTELGEFLNLPLHCYSTGMVMHLAFAIATSSNPEILLIDEVFAVGDLSFQKKAERRLIEYIQRAKIVVMVGHNLEFLNSFCTRSLWIDHGILKSDGPTSDVIAQYTRESENRRLAA